MGDVVAAVIGNSVTEPGATKIGTEGIGASGGNGCSTKPLARYEKRLLLYALRCQAEEGPCSEPRPWPWDVVEHAKWSAWANLGDMHKFEAMRIYCKAVEEEVPDWWEHA